MVSSTEEDLEIIGKRNTKPEIIIQPQLLTVYGRNEAYKYLGKELSLSGECKSQVMESQTITLFKDLVLKIKISSLPLALKSSALNNLVLAKVLHHFCNTRIDEVSLQKFDEIVTSTTQAVIYPRELGGIGIKRIYLMCTEPHDWLS